LPRLAIPRIECVESRGDLGCFVVGPLEKGFDITLGNALRRVLLGYLPGAAVTRVKIEGIQHEFSTIPHVKEDTIELLLNLKELRLKPITGRPAKLRLEVERVGQVCATDIEPSADFEIINPELYLATLDSPEARLYIEMDVELGEGYKLAADLSDNVPAGTIPLDAIFTPVKKVNFTTAPVHVGKEISRELLRLEIWTDGTISPTDALSQAASILIEQLTPFVEYPRISQMKDEEQMVRLSIPDEQYNMPVEQLNLSVRTMNCLRRAGISTIGELMSKGEKELLSLRNFGQKSRVELEEHLTVLGLSMNPQGKQETDEISGLAEEGELYIEPAEETRLAAEGEPNIEPAEETGLAEEGEPNIEPAEETRLAEQIEDSPVEGE